MGVLYIITVNCTIAVEVLCEQIGYSRGNTSRHDMVADVIGDLFEWYQTEKMGVPHEPDGPRIDPTDPIVCDGALLMTNKSRQCAWCTVQGSTLRKVEKKSGRIRERCRRVKTHCGKCGYFFCAIKCFNKHKTFSGDYPPHLKPQQ